MLWNTLRKLSNNKQFLEGGRVGFEHFRYPFRQDFQLMVNMFEIRRWVMTNTPYIYDHKKIGNEMSHLHNELNYQQSRMLRRRLLVAGVLLYSWFYFNGQYNWDWRDTFDLKFNRRIYGTLTSSAGEGTVGIDE